MGDPRPEKVAVVDEVRGRLDRAGAAILTEYRGLSVKDLAVLRRALRDAGGEYRVYKNTLVRFAARDLGLAELDPLLTGPTAIAFVDPAADGRGGDPSEVAKVLREYARTNAKLVVKGGVLGSRVMSAADTAALADLPPRDVVLARVAGALAGPLQQFAGLLQALPRNFAYGLKALIDQTGGGAAEEPAPDDGGAAGEPSSAGSGESAALSGDPGGDAGEPSSAGSGESAALSGDPGGDAGEPSPAGSGDPGPDPSAAPAD
jgi:large subunit ribosomal protein L10